MTLFDVKTPRVRMPRHGVTAGVSRPVWSEYRPKTPVDCNHCEMVAYETAIEGKPYPGMRTARRKRRQDGKILLLCHEHAQAVGAQDAIDFPAGESRSERKSNAGQRYIA